MGDTMPQEATPEEFLALGQQVLAQQAFSRLVGAELTVLRRGFCQLEVAVREELLQQNGVVHGGVLAYLADNALTYAGGTAMAVPVMTAKFKVNYVRPGSGERLVARAEAVAVGRNQAVCRCDVYAIADGVEKLCAVAQGTIARRGEPSA